jgi:predicted kinase
MNVIILQGIPGSGKSSYVSYLKGVASDISREVVVCSADHYFMRDGEYKFNPAFLGEAHAACMRRFIETVQQGGNVTVIVDNTNITEIEIAPYYAVARAFGSAKVEIVTFEVYPETGAARNVHGVPFSECCRMDNILQSFIQPSWWEVTKRVLRSSMGGTRFTELELVDCG